MKERTVYDHIMTVCKALFVALIFACLIFAFSYNISDPGTRSSIDPESMKLRDWTVVMEDGTQFHADEPYADEPAYSVPYSLYTTLPDEIDGEHYLCFMWFKDTAVSIDGVVRRDFSQKRDVHLFGGPVKPTYAFIPVYPEDAGKTLSLLRTRGETDRRVYPTMLYGTASEIFHYMIKVYALAFVFYLILLAISLVIVVVGIALTIRLRRPIDMMFAGLAVLITTVWLITDSFIYPFVFDHYYIDGVLSYLSCMMIPMPFFIYMNALQKGRYVKYYVFLQILTFSSFFLWTTLHFTGLFPFNKALYYLDAVLVVDIVCGLAISIVDIVRGHVREYMYTAIGFLGFAILSFFQIIVIFTMDLNNDGELLLLGLLFLLVFVVLQQLVELAEADREKRHVMELSDAKTRFLASMSHEIRTPINSILGMNEMILRENHDDTIGEYAMNVQSAGKMLLALINDVLDFSRIESGKLEITNADYKLAGVLADVAKIARERAASKNLAFDVHPVPGLPSVLHSDEVRIKQILINLLTNAVKYTDRGNVMLDVSGNYESDQDYRLKFVITDTGRGIREEEQKDLFNAFTRADLAQNRNVEGTGLGLAIVKSIVDSMDGEISVQSVYGEGSTFSVILPQKVVDPTPLPTDLDLAGYGDEVEEYHCAFTAPDAKVLAVDDNSANLSIVRQFLKNTKITIDCCMNGNAALEKCIRNKYDLILLDHMMPDPDGIVTLQKIRSNGQSQNRDTKAVVLTANAVAGSRQMYLNAGFVDYLTKPIDSALLEQTVEKYLPPEKVVKGTVAEAETSAGGFSEGFRLIEEIDYDTAMHYCKSEDVLEMISEEIVEDITKRKESLKTTAAERDFPNYRIHAHAIKSNLATIGAKDLSERAKKHEFAGRDEEEAFIRDDMEDFLAACETLCGKIKQLLP